MSKPNNAKQVAIATTKKVSKGPDGQVIVTVESLDDVIRNAQKITSQKNFVPGHSTYEPGVTALKGFLASACAITTALINTDNSGLDNDKYNLLSAKTKSFGSKNDLANELLRELKEERLQDAQINRDVNPEDPENAKPFTEDQVANIQGNPKADDPESKVIDEVTKDGGRMQFDKANFEIRVFLKDGSIRTIHLTPEGSWRQTIAKWLVAFMDAVAVAVNTVANTISEGFKKVTGWFKKKEEPAKAEVNQEGEVVAAAEQAAQNTEKLKDVK